jgi:hypothetical protein
MARCNYCGKDIIWLQEGKKKVPVENDGIKHECEEFKNSTSSLKTVELNHIDPEILKQYQANMDSPKGKRKKKN